jgi:hypothetical protein
MSRGFQNLIHVRIGRVQILVEKKMLFPYG